MKRGRSPIMLDRRRTLSLLAGGALGMAPLRTLANTPIAAPTNDLTTELDLLFRDQDVEIPFSGAALVTLGGIKLLDDAYGPADGIAGRDNTIDTGFQIASVTKTLTAALIMQLRDEGAFALDDPAAGYLPTVASELERDGIAVTIRHLLNHTSGVVDFLELYDPLDILSYPESLDALLERIAREPLLFTPGERFHYSSSGYLYLGRIVEQITGQPWEEALAARILEPVGMGATWLTPPPSSGPLALGYLKVELFVIPVSRFGRPDLAEAAGGLTSTTADLHTWIEAFFDGVVVGPSTVEEMLPPGSWDYGLGWSTFDFGGARWIGHFGETIGFRSALFHQPDLNANIIILSNRQDYPISELVDQISARIIAA